MAACTAPASAEPSPASRSASRAGSPASRVLARATSTVRLPSVRSPPAGLPVTAGIAEHPEQVVAELERRPDRDPVAAQPADHLRRRAGQRRAQLQRALDGVGRRLEPVDGHRVGQRPWAARRPGTHRHVEQLPGQHLGAHRPPRLLHPVQGPQLVRGRGEQVVRPGQREVTEQHRDGQAVLVGVPVVAGVGMRLGHRDVHARPAAPGLRAVDHIVVHQRAGLDQFEGGGDPDHRRAVGRIGPAAAGPPAPPEKLRAQPFSVGDEVDQQVDRGGQPWVDGEQFRAPRRQLGGQHGLHRRAQGGRDGRDLGSHPASVPDHRSAAGRPIGSQPW